MKTTELSLLAITAGHLSFFSLPLLYMGAWFWGGLALFVALLLGLRFARVALADGQREVDEMSAGTVAWHPKSGSGPRGEMSFEEEVEELLRLRAEAGKGGAQ